MRPTIKVQLRLYCFDYWYYDHFIPERTFENVFCCYSMLQSQFLILHSVVANIEVLCITHSTNVFRRHENHSARATTTAAPSLRSKNNDVQTDGGCNEYRYCFWLLHLCPKQYAKLQLESILRVPFQTFLKTVYISKSIKMSFTLYVELLLFETIVTSTGSECLRISPTEAFFHNERPPEPQQHHQHSHRSKQQQKSER
jgi:hypothetical protein